MPSPTVYDLVIRNALILDGTGAPGQPGDLAVEGGTIARIEAYAERLASVVPSVNVVPLIGHGSLRALTMADPMQKADSCAIAAMRRHLADALEEGATGFSTGLFYPLNAPADIEEVTTLAELLPAHGGIYATHMRNEHDGVMSSLAETFETAGRAKVPVVVSHHKCAGRANWGRSAETLPL